MEQKAAKRAKEKPIEQNYGALQKQRGSGFYPFLHKAINPLALAVGLTTIDNLSHGNPAA
jgi:hypothetical protein